MNQPNLYRIFTGACFIDLLPVHKTNTNGMNVAEHRHSTAAPIKALKAAVEISASKPRKYDIPILNKIEYFGTLDWESGGTKVHKS